MKSTILAKKVSVRPSLVAGLMFGASLLAITCANSIAMAQNAQASSNEAKVVTRLDEIVVTGTRTNKRLADSVVRTEIISEDTIRDSQSRNLADAVEFTTGVRVESNCVNCNFSQIRLNGLPGSFTQILFDSQQSVSSLAAVYGVEQIPSSLIQKIEVVKGGASSLYGPGAIGGVVNIIPHEPTEGGVEVSYRKEWMEGKDSTAANDSISSVLNFVSDDELTNGFLFAQREEIGALDLSGDKFTEISQRELDTFGMRLNRRFDDIGAKLTVDYNHIREDRRGGDNIDAPPHEAEIAEDIQSRRNGYLLGWSHSLSEDLDYRVTASYSHFDRDSYYGAGGDLNAYGTSKNNLYNLDTQVNHYFDYAGAHTFSWGIQHNRSEIKDEQPAYDRFVDDTFYYTGMYIQDDWEITPDFNFITGARIDKHSEIDDAIISPRVAFLANIADNTRVRGSISTGFRAPEIFDEDLHIAISGGEGLVIRNSSDLKEEQSISYQLGAEYTPPIGRGVGLLEANIFWTQIEDAFFNDLTDDPATTEQTEYTRINRGGSSIFGVEFNVGYQIADTIDFQLGYVEQRARYDDADDDFGTRNYFRTPERYASAIMNWKNPDFVDVFLGLKYTGPMQVPHLAGAIASDRLEKSESFLTIDANISKTFDIGRFDGLTLTAGARNITNEIQSNFDNGPLRDADYIYGPRLPRSIFLGATYKF